MLGAVSRPSLPRSPLVLDRRAASRVALAVFVALSLCPILLVEIPAMVDYPNHLARMSVLARAGSPAANPHYEVAWALYPNLAMDLVVPPLARLLGVELATRLFYLAGQVLVVTGAMAIARAARGTPVAAGTAATLVLYGIPFAWGFVNFEVALGAALWGIAAWIALAPRPPALRLAAHAGLVALLAVGHLFALGIYGVAIGLYELWRAKTEGRSLARLAGTLALMAAPVAVLGAIGNLTGGTVGGERTEWWFGQKLGWLFFLNGFSREVSLGLTAVLAFLGYAMVRAGHLRLAGAGPWIACGFALLYLVMPFRLRDTSFVDVRVLVAAALILPAFVRIEVPRGPWRRLGLGVLALVALTNLAVVAAVQWSYRSEYRAMIASFDHLPRGARVLVGTSGEEQDPPANLMDYPILHAPTLAVHYADALVPTMFTYPGKQPVATREAERHLASRQDGPIPLEVLLLAADGALPRSEPPFYFTGWPRDFEFLYLLGPRSPNPRPALLERLAGTDRFTLYRIRNGGPATRP